MGRNLKTEIFNFYDSAMVYIVQPPNELNRPAWLTYQQQKGILKNQSVLRRIIAEVYIDAKEYLDAIRQYDIAIRQSENPRESMKTIWLDRNDIARGKEKISTNCARNKRETVRTVDLYGTESARLKVNAKNTLYHLLA